MLNQHRILINEILESERNEVKIESTASIEINEAEQKDAEQVEKLGSTVKHDYYDYE
jgi:hypothetical protein